MKKILTIVLASLLFGCAEDANFDINPSGTGGSLARFTIVNDKMYVVSTDSLKTLSLANPAKPTLIDGQKLTDLQDIETLFAFANNLFIGSQSAMYIYNLDSLGIPVRRSRANHTWGCDPVVANDTLAFVTIRNTPSNCRPIPRTDNILDVYNVRDISNPRLLKSFPMTSPIGLGLDNRTLFVCDSGIKVFDIRAIDNMYQRAYLPNIDAIDVITQRGRLVVIGKKKLTQLDYTNLDSIKVISVMNLKN